MKKIVLLLITVIFTACSAGQKTAQDGKEYTLITKYDTDYAFTENGVYEAMGHMDSSTDILFIDMANGTRAVKGDMTIETTPSTSEKCLFTIGDYIYFISDGDLVDSPDERENAVLYKFSKDGKLIKKHSFDKLFRPSIMAFVHDGKDLYFRAAQYVQNENELIPNMGLYRLDTDTFEAERLCDASFRIYGAWKNQLIVGVNEQKDNEYTHYVEALDMTTYEHKRLFRTDRMWFQIDGKLYNQHEIPGSLKTYDLETNRFSEIKLFDFDPVDVKYYIVEHYGDDRNILFKVARTEAYIETRYAYNIDTEEITPVNMSRFIYGKAGDCYLVSTGQQTIYIGKEMYERADNVYAFVKCEDYISGNPQFRYIASSIDYR